MHACNEEVQQNKSYIASVWTYIVQINVYNMGSYVDNAGVKRVPFSSLRVTCLNRSMNRPINTLPRHLQSEKAVGLPFAVEKNYWWTVPNHERERERERTGK